MRFTKRKTYFVCISVKNNEVISEVIESEELDSAIQNYNNIYGFNPQKVLGPFFKKKNKPLEIQHSMKFLDHKPIKCQYNDWNVNAFKLSEPQDAAYLIFTSRIDGKKISPPSGNIIVKLTDLRIL